MDTRSTSTSGRKKRKKTSHSNSSQPAGNIIASKQIEEFSCPVTLDIFFEPVMISTCGHIVEGRSTQGLRKCPLCRVGNNSTVICAAPPQVTNVLSQTLAADPTLWQQVYLDHDYLDEVLRKEELNTPTGERFIKLLENNSTENLNEQPLIERNGKVEKGKSAIEILANHYVGRNLLRSNARIQDLITDKTKEIKADGKTIAEWLAMEKEEKPIAIDQKMKKVKRCHQPSQNGIFANNARPARQAEDNVWQRVVYGNEAGVLELLRQNTNLVTEKHTVTDYSDRVVDDATPFQMALRAGDEVMANKIKDLYLRANPANGQQVLDDQFNEVFPEGYAAHLRAQQQAADEFEREYINPLVEAITNASREELNDALSEPEGNHESIVFEQLQAFQVAFDELSKNEKVYNPNHLLKAFEKYNEKFDAWYVNSNNPDHWLRLDLFWRQVIGWQERYMSTNYAQSFCTGLANMVNDNQPLQRTLSLHNYANGQDIQFFPLGRDDSSKLGSDFGVYSYNGAAAPWAWGLWRVPRRLGRFARRLQNLCQTKTASLGELCSESRIAIRPGV